jgi:hypothetical protein
MQSIIATVAPRGVLSTGIRFVALKGGCAVVAATLAFAGGTARADETAPTAGADQAIPVKQVPRRAKTVMLSNERTLSRWAHPARLADIYSRHRASSRRVARLRFFTEDGFPEVYLLVAQWTSADGDEWVKVRVPKRPNGKTGWVPRDALGPFNVVRTQLVVNRRTLRATLFKRGRKIWSAPVGIGAPSTPTPAGRFWIREKFRFKNTPVYGTHALGTAAYAPNLSDWPNGGVVGLHGTNAPGLIPGRPSHGCVRIKNPAIAKLFRLTPVGTPLLIK